MRTHLTITIHQGNSAIHISPNKLTIVLILVRLLSTMTEIKNGPFIVNIMLQEIALLTLTVN